MASIGDSESTISADASVDCLNTTSKNDIISGENCSADSLNHASENEFNGLSTKDAYISHVQSQHQSDENTDPYLERCYAAVESRKSASRGKMSTGSLLYVPPLCEICGNIFHNVSEYLLHYEEHGNSNQDLTTVEGSVHSRKKKNSSDSGSALYMFEECGKICQNSYQLTSHERSHLTVDGSLHNRKKNNSSHSDSAGLCEECGKMCKNTYQLSKHKRCHSGERPFHCSQCPATFATRDGLRCHLVCHMDEKPYHCNYCPKGFNRKYVLKEHVATLHPAMSVDFNYSVLSCRDCGENFRSSNKLHAHRLQMHSDRTLCKLCSKRCPSLSALTEHLRQHSTEDWELLCKTHNLAFPSYSHLNKRTQAHVRENGRPFICSECGKSFMRLTSLNTHKLLVHDNKSRFYCCTCGEGFQRRCYLQSHERIHTGEKPFHCTTCGRRFRVKQALQFHERIHTGCKPYCCNICGKCFRVWHHLKRHNQMHTDERPYCCTLCDKAYRLKTDLHIHYSRVHQLETSKVQTALPVG